MLRPGRPRGGIDTNLTGAIRIIRAALPMMRRQGSGRIVNVGSVAAEPKLGMPLMSVYGATKAGLRSLIYGRLGLWRLAAGGSLGSRRRGGAARRCNRRRPV